MQKLVWQNANGVELDLTSGNYGITEWEGFSNASLNIQSQQVPFQDGGVFLDALMEQRELSVTLAMQDNNNLELRYQQRRELISALNPKLGEGYLIYTNDFISKRIKCVPQIPLFETHNSDTVGTPKASLSWTACEPYWEDLEETIVNFGISEQPIIENKGDIPVGLQVELFTQNTINPSIKNITQNKEIKLQGEIDSNILINTKTGQKTVLKENFSFKDLSNTMTYRKIIYVNGKNIFVLLGQQQWKSYIFISEDAKTWELTLTPDISGMQLLTIFYYEKTGTILIGGKVLEESVYKGCIYKSNDGKNWELQLTDNRVYGFSYSPDLDKLLYFSDKKIFSSDNGTDWSSVYEESENIDIHDLIWFKTKFVAAIENGWSLVSEDGIIWEKNFSSNLSNSRGLFIYKNNIIVVGGINVTKMSISEDGITWNTFGTELDTPSMIIYNEKLGIFISISRTIKTSTDGSIWNNSDYNKNIELSDIIYIDEIGLFLAVGAQGIVIQTINGLNWEVNNIGMENIGDSQFSKIAYSTKRNIYVGAGNGHLYRSLDGVKWEKTIDETANDIIYVEALDLFVLVYSVILISQDGLSWENVSPAGSWNMNNVIYIEEKKILLAAGGTYNNGYTFSSSDGRNWSGSWAFGQTMANCTCYSPIDGSYYAYNSTGIYESTFRDRWNYLKSIPYSIIEIVYINRLKMFLGITSNRELIYSGDAKNWETLFTSDYDFTKLLWCEEIGRFIIVGWDNDPYSACFIIGTGLNDIKIYTFENKQFWGATFNKNEDTVLIGGMSGFISAYVLEIAKETNMINRLTNNSDMTLGLEIGENKFLINYSAGDLFARITYRQKYIGV